MTQVTRKIGMNKGKRRIWLEGAVLTDNGIHHGMRFEVMNNLNSIDIVITATGKRKIAGRPDRPIIDMSAATITNSFSDEITAVIVEKYGFGLRLTGISA